MSFVTKREKVFEPDLLVELPARSEGKIKNYSSCTDARAWSHHTTDQTEHLMENIKRNTCICRPKYLSTEVIVKTLTTSKNKEIAKLKRKIAQLEEMLAAYDCLDLSCAQKCEIAKAHESIKTCYQDLNDMSLELDLSGYTEGVDSETFETGKSGGDTTDRSCCTRSMDSRKRRSDVKFTNMGDSSMPSCKCDKATSARDKSCTELEQMIKQKDAKLKSLQNTIKIMENDSCEPYCVYAHIYTALEKIFCVLNQNAKYREYLFVLSKGQREGTDIKTKIYSKLRILEKFSAGLISPCVPQYQKNCSCYHLQITSHIGTSYTVTSSENKRALLAADIMETEEFKEILDQEKEIIDENVEIQENSLAIEEYDIDKKNLNRLILLQKNYEELIICYENVKHERDIIQNKYFKYEELEDELQMLRDQLSKFDDIKLERDGYKTRLDEINAQQIDLSEEALNFKMQLKAESEINLMKTNKIAELRNENIALEKKINDIEMKYGKEKNSLQCKIMEMECKMMCQEQQIKSLTEQTDRLVKENNDKPTRDTPDPIELTKEISVLKTQVNRLKEMLCSNEEEKKSIEEELNNGLEIINELKREIGAWKESYETALKRNDKLEKCTEDSRKEIDQLMALSKNLSNENTEKSEAVENLLNVIKNKSLEINRLLNEIENQKKENSELRNQLVKNEIHSDTEVVSQCEDTNSLDSIISVEEDEYNDEVICDPNNVILYLNTQTDFKKCKKVCERLVNKIEKLQKFSGNLETENKILLQELKRLQDLNGSTINDVNKLENDKKEYSNKLESALKETKVLERKLSEYQMLSSQMQKLQNSYAQLLNEKNELETVIKNESKELSADLKEFKSLKDSVTYLCQKLINGETIIQTGVPYQSKEVGNLMKHIEILQIKNQNLSEKYNVTRTELNHLKNRLEVLIAEKNELQNEVEDKTNAINKLQNLLEKEIEKNENLYYDIQNLKANLTKNTKGNLGSNNDNPSTLKGPERSDEYENLTRELFEAKKAYIEMESQKDKFLKRFEEQMSELRQIRIENQSLYDQKKILMIQNTNLENDLEELRNEIMAKACAPQFNCSVIVKETEQMKKEKIQSIEKNHELLEKIDEMDNTISDLREQLVARTDKIAILENYINALEDEIRNLQQSLGLAVSTGEQICYNGVKNKEDTLKIMDLNRSKIVRDLKKQIKKLQDENTTVEKQWFALKLQFDELEREKKIHTSEIIHLKNERNVILGEFRQLEVKLIGDSTLLPQNTSLEEILSSLKRVMKCIEAKDAKNSTLEHTLIKVQTSSQLLLNKADEAKTIIEKEKLKICNEKEEAVRDKFLMTKELSSLKEKLENQITIDKQIIKDLEAELLNHKLIIQNINKTKGNEIIKFEKEMQYLRNMYKQSVLETKELRETLQSMILEKEINQEKHNNSSKILNQKIEEINSLKEQLSELRSKLDQKSETETQTDIKVSDINITTQTVFDLCDFSCDTSDIIKYNKISDLNAHENENDAKLGGKNDDDIISTQIMNKDLTIPCKDQSQLDDFLRCCINQKINKLSIGTLEQFSITTIESINCNDRNKTNEKSTTLKYYDIWKNTPEQLVQHMLQKELNKKRSAIEVESLVTEKCSKTRISIKSEQKPFNELFHLINKKNKIVHIENQSLLQNESQINTTMVCGDKINKSNRKYFIESCKQDLSLGETYSIDNNTLDNNKREDCYNFCHHIYNNLISCRATSLTKDYKLKRNISCTATAHSDRKLDSDYDKPVSLNTACETKCTPMNSYLYSVYSANNLVVYSDENFMMNDLLNEEALTESKMVTSYSDHKAHSSQPNLASCNDNEEFPKYDSKIQFLDSTRKNSLINNFAGNETYVTQNNKQEINFDNIEEHKNFGTTTHTVNTVKQKLFLQNPNEYKNKYSHKIYSDSITPTHFDDNFIKITKNKLKINAKDSQEYKKDKSIEVDVPKTKLDNDGSELMSERENVSYNNDTAQTDAYDDYNKNVLGGNTEKLQAKTPNETNVLYTNEAVIRPASAKQTSKNQDHQIGTDKMPMKINNIESNQGPKTLVTTKVVAVEIKPTHLHDECVCVLGLNAPALVTKHEGENDDRERVYSMHIARKVLSKDIEDLDVDELKFLHSKVCQSWRSKLKSDKALAKRLEILENVKRPGHDLRNVSELQRKVREERQRLLEFRKAVFRTTPVEMRTENPEPRDILAEPRVLNSNTLRPHFGELRTLFNNAERDVGHPLNKNCRLIDDTASGLRTKVNAYRTTQGRQLTEDKQEVRERRGGTTNEQPARIRRGAAVGRQHKK